MGALDEGGSGSKGHRGKFEVLENVLFLDLGGGIPEVCTCKNSLFNISILVFSFFKAESYKNITERHWSTWSFGLGILVITIPPCSM